MTAIFWEAGEKGRLRLPSCCEIEDWDFTPIMRQSEVEAFLRDNELPFEHSDPLSTPETVALILPTGIHIHFDENGQLHSVYAC